MNKIRLDIYVKNKLNISRAEAAELIKGGYVFENGKSVFKAAFLTDGSGIEIDKGGIMPYCSRGGLKLKKAVDEFGINLTGKVCLDIGASTGGFTHCMLLEGAKHVYAVDVGRNQLKAELADDLRVTSAEQTNILDVDGFKTVPQFVAADVSFVSLTKIINKAYELTDENAEGVFLIKPQFEAGRGFINKNGICKDKRAHIRVIDDIISFCKKNGFKVKGITFSPIKGGDGNVEYLLYAVKQGESMLFDKRHITSVVESAAAVFKRKTK